MARKLHADDQIWEADAAGSDNSTLLTDSTKEMSATDNRAEPRAVIQLAIVVLIFCSTIARAGQPTRLPGKQSSLVSPDKQHELINRDTDGRVDVGDNHALFLREAKTGAEKKIHIYGRHVEAFWSPDSRFIAITDFAASDESLCYIYRVVEGKMVNLADALTKALAGTGKLKNHHVYFQAVTWQKGPVLKVRVNGYGDHDKKGFETWCLYDLAKDRATLPSPK